MFNDEIKRIQQDAKAKIVELKKQQKEAEKLAKILQKYDKKTINLAIKIAENKNTTAEQQQLDFNNS
jgi:hypothetical protein